jgi:hypothetical protein
MVVWRDLHNTSMKNLNKIFKKDEKRIVNKGIQGNVGARWHERILHNTSMKKTNKTLKKNEKRIVKKGSNGTVCTKWYERILLCNHMIMNQHTTRNLLK